MTTASSDGDTPLTFDSPSLSWSEPAAPASEASPTSEPTVPDAAVASPPAGATTPPPDTPGTGEQPRDETGPLPFERHRAILEAERQKRTDLEAKWQRVQWADELVQRGATQEQVQQALSVRGDLQRDPVVFIERLLAEAAGRPDLVQQVRSIAGRVLGTSASAPSQAPASDDQEPKPDFQSENGTPFYSAPQLQKWQEWNQRRMQAVIDQRLAPIEHERQARQAETSRRETFNRFYEDGSKQLDELKKLPHFNENFEKVKAYMETQNYGISLDAAFLHVLTSDVLPALSQTERAKTIAELRTQAAGTSVNPKSGAASVPASPKGFFDPALKW
jgi:hypothetical protein